MYYLKSVETKSHIAFFITNTSQIDRWRDEIRQIATDYQLDTNQVRAMLERYLEGSQQQRRDGLGAALLNSSQDPAASKPGEQGSQSLEHLEKIILFSKARLDKPIKTVCFQYDYTLVRNLPNNQDGNYPNARTVSARQSGKLTLRRLWFEYEGLKNAKISPYEFSYKYKDLKTFPDYLQSKYPEATSVNASFSDQAQNPDYNPHALDTWGNIQAYGDERKKYDIPWLYQGNEPAQGDSKGGWRSEIDNNSSSDFDPAAWQLKQIKLPSGGQILIEYEQKDYAYVQDRAPMAMASLLAADDPVPGFINLDPRYTIDVRDLGIDPTDTDEIARQIQAMKSYFNEEKIYFKFLYKLWGD
ncbi:MAG: hypothetical protein AAFU64_19210, partial [Bacteroidota bacterium]